MNINDKSIDKNIIPTSLMHLCRYYCSMKKILKNISSNKKNLVHGKKYI